MTKQLTKCCDLLQKMRVRLELSRGSICFVFWSRVLSCLNLMYVFIVLVKFG